MMKFQILSVCRSYDMCNISIMALMFSRVFHESKSESNFLVN